MKFLFITHDTSRTGAPLVLLQFLNWLKSNQANLEFDVIGLEGGVLETDFKKVCHTYYSYRELIKTKPLKLRQRLLLKLGLFKRTNPKMIFLQKLANSNYNVVYANTIITIPLATDIIKISPKTKLIAHVHELNAVIKCSLPNFFNYISSIHQFIAASRLVETNLANNWNISKNIIEMVYECSFIDIKEKGMLPKNNENNVFTIGASGNVHWRKGHDMFLQVARYINSNFPDVVVKFVWVGKISSEEHIILEEDIQKLDLKAIVLFTGEVENPSIYFNDFDVFVMTSREDPFPLVCIEVGMLGKPIICFKGATGSEEIIENGGGFIVPYLDVEAMGKKIIEYYKSPELIANHGLINKVAFAQFTPELICPKLFSTIQNVINR
jgi:glycosyltransferase involved in cell wall biosynthesis